MSAAAASPAATADVAGRPGRYWWLLLIAGALTVVVGLAALVYPGPTLLVVGVLFGAYLAVWGAITLFGGITDGALSSIVRFLHVLIGLLAVFAGLVLLVRPGQSVLTAAWVLGFWWVLLGVVQFARGLAVSDGRVWNLIWGVVAAAAGIIILAQPDIGLITLVWIAGIALIVQGMLEIAAAMAWRRLNRTGAA